MAFPNLLYGSDFLYLMCLLGTSVSKAILSLLHVAVPLAATGSNWFHLSLFHLKAGSGKVRHVIWFVNLNVAANEKLIYCELWLLQEANWRPMDFEGERDQLTTLCGEMESCGVEGFHTLVVGK